MERPSFQDVRKKKTRFSVQCVYAEVRHTDDPAQGLIQATVMSVRRHKKLNLLIEFSNSIFTNFILKHVGVELAFKIN